MIVFPIRKETRMRLGSSSRLYLSLAAIGCGTMLAIVAASAQQPVKPVELFRREACIAPIQNKFNGTCLVQDVIGALLRRNAMTRSSWPRRRAV